MVGIYNVAKVGNALIVVGVCRVVWSTSVFLTPLTSLTESGQFAVCPAQIDMYTEHCESVVSSPVCPSRVRIGPIRSGDGSPRQRPQERSISHSLLRCAGVCLNTEKEYRPSEEFFTVSPRTPLLL